MAAMMKNSQVAVYTSNEEEREHIFSEASRRGLSAASLVREAVEAYLRFQDGDTASLEDREREARAAVENLESALAEVGIR